MRKGAGGVSFEQAKASYPSCAPGGPDRPPSSLATAFTQTAGCGSTLFSEQYAPCARAILRRDRPKPSGEIARFGP
jgi:hypothetical protein